MMSKLDTEKNKKSKIDHSTILVILFNRNTKLGQIFNKKIIMKFIEKFRSQLIQNQIKYIKIMEIKL
jgi:hypothetical protein